MDLLTDILYVRQYLAQHGLFLNASVTLVDIGNINYVYRLVDHTGTYYLKYYGIAPRRTNSAIEKIGYEPGRFINERDALLLLRRLLPAEVITSLPEIVYCDVEARVLILTDIARNGQILRELLLLDPTLVSFAIYSAARFLAQQHACTLRCKDLTQNEAFNKRFYDFRTIHSCVVLSAEQQQAVAQRAQQIWDNNIPFACLINADYSPKQIYVYDSGIGICDFELVSLGVASYDVGFFVGQIKIVEYITEDSIIGDLASTFVEQYFATLTQELPERSDFIAFTREHLDFFIGLGILNRLDAAPLEKFIPSEKVPFLRECALSFIFKRMQPKL